MDVLVGEGHGIRSTGDLEDLVIGGEPGGEGAEIAVSYGLGDVSKVLDIPRPAPERVPWPLVERGEAAGPGEFPNCVWRGE